ncbi:MAG: hypothetical protein GTN73_03930 [Candidatus Aminicenantes bacterium]|nr:hypothetical protein [Candidatus Aminicenantes bacterium]
MKKGKIFLSLFLVFFLLALSGNLYAKKRGAELEVQQKDGRQLTGELIAVKQNTLLLLDSETGADVSVDIKDIVAITIVKKSQALAGATFGALAGGGIGAIVGTLVGKPAPIILSSMAADKKTILRGLFFGSIIGVVCGGLAGAETGTDKRIQIEGMSDLKIKEAMDKLRKKARIPDYK